MQTWRNGPLRFDHAAEQKGKPGTVGSCMTHGKSLERP